MVIKILTRGVAALVVAVLVWGIFLTRDGNLVTPTGQDTVITSSGEFEAFPLPDYAAKFIDDDYKSYLVDVAPGIKVHVLEVGSGYPVYMQSGMPMSGFLYRKVAEALPREQFRIIMPTMVGLGFSSKIPASEHQLKNHLSWMGALLEKLALKEVIFVGHDWGGPIGAGALARSTTDMNGAIILNTALDAPREPRPIPTFLKIVRTPIVGELMLEGFFSVFDQLPSVQKDPTSLPPEVLDIYARPLSDDGNGKAPLALARMSAFDPAHPDIPLVQATEDYVTSLDVPVELVWGMSDPVLGKRLADMKKIFPKANVVETQAGHFLQEEVPEEIASSIQRVHLQMQSQK